MSKADSPPINPDALSIVLATDCGSTTTKAVLFEKRPEGWRQTFRGEAPTTVEKPVADVTIGVQNAFLEVEELSGRKILGEAQGDSPPMVMRKEPGPRNSLASNDNDGIDLYVSTSSAGGGLQMIVAGVVASMTTESAERAALGAGAIVMDAVSIDDGREPYERVKRIRHLRPDIVLIAGGTEGGSIDHPLELAELVLQAEPRPRFGETLRLPIIYAANSFARAEAEKLLKNRFAFVAVENIRPSLDHENLGPARDAIHEIFLNHVMSHAPGYKKLLGWTPVPILPTPAAVGNIVQNAAKTWNQQILAVDIGGATTDVFSVFRVSADGNEHVFNRTVSANLGMSYSVANVLLEAGEANIQRWLPFDVSFTEIRDRLRNKMIRPTSIPYLLEDLLLEQAVCREALRLAFFHHRRLVVGLRGVQKRRSIDDLFRQGGDGSLVDMLGLDLIIGSGGVLSHAPDRKSGAFMMIDAFEPQGVTKLAVDSIFMMPHLGVFASIHPKAAAEIFMQDCLVDLGTVIAPVGGKAGESLLEVAFGGKKEILKDGELRCIPLSAGEKVQAKITPLVGRVDIGSGPGKTLELELSGGHAGIILDGRGRPLILPASSEDRLKKIRRWYEAFELAVS